MVASVGALVLPATTEMPVMRNSPSPVSITVDGDPADSACNCATVNVAEPICTEARPSGAVTVMVPVVVSEVSVGVSSPFS